MSRSETGPRFDRLLERWLLRNPLPDVEDPQVDVIHQAWCRYINRRGECNCDPVFAHEGEHDA